MLNVILFGAGDLLKETLSYLNTAKVRVIAVCDNDKSKRGAMIYGKRIIALKDIKCCDYDIIVISNKRYQTSIKKQLHEMGIKRVLPIYAANFNEREKKLYDCCTNVYGKMKLAYQRFVQKQFFSLQYVDCGIIHTIFREMGWQNVFISIAAI